MTYSILVLTFYFYKSCRMINDRSNSSSTTEITTDFSKNNLTLNNILLLNSNIANPILILPMKIVESCCSSVLVDLSLLPVFHHITLPMT